MGEQRSKPRRRVEVGQVGEWTFFEITGHSFSGDLEGKPLYEVEVAGGGERVITEMFASLDEAMVAAVGAKWTGPRGAGGTGVGTAADWFMRMIGYEQGKTWADQLAEAHAERTRR